MRRERKNSKRGEKGAGKNSERREKGARKNWAGKKRGEIFGGKGGLC
jgi:hypothetical protein